MSASNSLLLLLVITCCLHGTLAFGQPAIPPNSVNVHIEESLGAGCGQISNHTLGIICFDVYIEIDEPDWNLRSYVVWMDYGVDNSVLSYNSDLSCGHTDGGDINIDVFGKYRYSAANDTVPMIANERVLMHNFCLDIVSFAGLENHNVIAGGEVYNLNSSMYLCDTSQTNNCTNTIIPRSDTFFTNQLSFFDINPVKNPIGDVVCDYPNLLLSAFPEEATGESIIDCTPFDIEWIGPNGFVSDVADTVIAIVDPVSQSGFYYLTVDGEFSCFGYDSFYIDLVACSLAAIPQEPVTLSLIESVGQGCHRSTNHLDSQICFDVRIEAHEPGWALKAYTIWMDYGTSNDILSYAYDSACIATTRAYQNINLDVLGRYRFHSQNTFAEGFAFLPQNQKVNFHNFCLDIHSFSELQDQTITPGGDHFALLSQVWLVDQLDTLNTMFINPSRGESFELTSSSFLMIDPKASAECNADFLKLSSLAEDATGLVVADCETFQYKWIGPDSFVSFDSVIVMPIVDAAGQSGFYEVFVTGANGCKGHAAFNVDLVNCEIIRCEDYLHIDGPQNIIASQQARVEIISQGNVTISSDVEFGAPNISLMSFFEIPLGVNFETSIIGCP